MVRERSVKSLRNPEIRAFLNPGFSSTSSGSRDGAFPGSRLKSSLIRFMTRASGWLTSDGEGRAIHSSMACRLSDNDVAAVFCSRSVRILRSTLSCSASNSSRSTFMAKRSAATIAVCNCSQSAGNRTAAIVLSASTLRRALRTSSLAAGRSSVMDVATGAAGPFSSTGLVSAVFAVSLASSVEF